MPELSISERIASILAEKRALRQLVCRFDNPNEGVTYKKGNSPLTLADLAVDDYLYALIKERFPKDGWISEERPNRRRSSKNGLSWVVDPIDGTREFLEGIPHFSLSVALFDETIGQTRLGVVYNFIRDELFYGSSDDGQVHFEGNPGITKAYEKDAILISRMEARMGLFKPWEATLLLTEIGSIAYKLALLSVGRGKAIISLKKKNLWDILAGCFLATQAGFKVCSIDGRNLHLSLDGLQYPNLLIAKEPTLSELKTLISPYAS
jgi:myo-inositol-1(or 4)-monophosphatase